MNRNNLSKRKLNIIKRKILELERLNVRTKEFTDKEMKEKIRKILDEEYRANL